jgi:hypothetical protein
VNILRQGELARFLEQVRDPQRRSWIIMNPTSIGDTATVCSLAHEFVKKHGHGITMLVPPDHLPITQMFPGRFLRVLTADRPTMLYIVNNFVDANRFELDVPFCGHPYDHGDCRGDELFYLHKYPGRGGISFTDLMRFLLRLPWDSQLERPTILPEWEAEAQSLADSIGMPIGKSVLLFPANSSQLPQYPDVFWETLAARLNGNGYTVFTNMKGGTFKPKTMPIVGTTAIEVPIHLALPLVRLAGRTICSANGIQFLQLLGGAFKQMSVTVTMDSQRGDWELNLRKHCSEARFAQYMYPELCLDAPFAEFSVPFDGTPDELRRVAVAIADESTKDSSCVARAGTNGQLYLDEHRDWLKGLVAPVRT